MTPSPPIPTRLREFANGVTTEGDEDYVGVTVSLRCPRCRGVKFVLYWQHLLQGGQPVETSPVWIACAACRYHALLFDDHCEDLNGLADEGPAKIPQCAVKPYAPAGGLASYGVEVYVQYDDHDAGDVDDKSKINPDAYDWLTVMVEQPDGTTDAAIDFETA